MSEHPIRYWQSMTTADASHISDRDPVVILTLAAIEQHGQQTP